MTNASPVVFVHGILGFGPKELGPLTYWGSAFKVPSPLERFEASVGPLSSAHDRACELAAQIKGARVDYGGEHARRAGHKRYGYDFTGRGFVPGWNESQPVHLVGHSLGSPTIRCLQHLLAIDYWGWGSSERWVQSVTTISGVSNGSTLTYFFGADQRSGLLKKAILPTGLLLIIELYMYATRAIRDSIYNFDLDQWDLERRPGESLEAYLDRVAQSRFLVGRDNACYSLTLQGAYADNAIWPTYPNTYYLSYITEQTFRGLSGRYYAEPGMDPAMVPLATYVGHKEFASPPIPVPAFHSADWWENDGAVSTYSQKYPHVSGDHPVGGEFNDDTPTSSFLPGRWYYQWERGIDHLDVCIFPELTQIGWQRRFYSQLLQRLASL